MRFVLRYESTDGGGTSTDEKWGPAQMSWEREALGPLLLMSAEVLKHARRREEAAGQEQAWLKNNALVPELRVFNIDAVSFSIVRSLLSQERSHNLFLSWSARSR